MDGADGVLALSMRLAEIVLTFQSRTLLSRVMVPVRQVRCIRPTWGLLLHTQNTKHPPFACTKHVSMLCASERREGGGVWGGGRPSPGCRPPG